MPSQQSLREFVGAMDEAGFLKRINDEIRIDQIPRILEEHPTKAVLMEKIKDCEFSVLANAYSMTQHKLNLL
jgi:2,5-furandicarboxylate decarboxylase 1